MHLRFYNALASAKARVMHPEPLIPAMNLQKAIDDELKAGLASGGNRWEIWADKADQLIDSAGVLMERVIEWRRYLGPSENKTPAQLRAVSRSMTVLDTALMLYAFAIECLCNAAHLKGNGKLYSPAGRLMTIPGAGTHDLRLLCQAVGLHTRLSKHELELVDKLTLWHATGRYPAPNKYSVYGRQLLVNNRLRMRGIWGIGGDERTLRRVLGKSYRHIGRRVPRSASLLTAAYVARPKGQYVLPTDEPSDIGWPEKVDPNRRA